MSKILLSLLVLFGLLIVGGFVFLAFAPVDIEQNPVVIEVPATGL